MEANGYVRLLSVGLGDHFELGRSLVNRYLLNSFWFSFQTTEPFFHGAGDLWCVMSYAARDNHNDAFRLVPAVVILTKNPRICSKQTLRRTDDAHPKPSPRIHHLMKCFAHFIGRLVFPALDFFQNHIPLFFNVLFFKSGRQCKLAINL